MYPNRVSKNRDTKLLGFHAVKVFLIRCELQHPFPYLLSIDKKGIPHNWSNFSVTKYKIQKKSTTKHPTPHKNLLISILTQYSQGKSIRKGLKPASFSLFFLGN